MSLSIVFNRFATTNWSRSRLVLVLLLPTAAVFGQDFAPASVADMVYAVVRTKPLGENAPKPHAAVLLKDGTRLPINVGLLIPAPKPGTYAWAKKSATTATLLLIDPDVAARLEITFTSANRGTYREFTTADALLAEGIFSLAPVPRDPTPPLPNLSTRTVLAAGQLASVGFVVDGTIPRRVLVRAIGPSLAQFGVANPAANPSLTVFKGSTQIGVNNGWGGAPSLAAIFSTVGAFALPPTSRDCALVLTLDPGPYTAQVRGEVGSEVLLEVYFVD